MGKLVQDAFPGEGFQQDRIPAIERAADKYDEKRALIGGLNDELATLDFKLRETMHGAETQLDKQEGPDGETLLVYKRGDYKVVIGAKEKLKVKIKEKSKGEPTDA